MIGHTFFIENILSAEVHLVLTLNVQQNIALTQWPSAAASAAPQRELY